MELGLYTFAENTPDPATGRLLPPAERLRNLPEDALRSIELYGTKVAPVVRRELGVPEGREGVRSPDSGGGPTQAPTPGSDPPSRDQK